MDNVRYEKDFFQSNTLTEVARNMVLRIRQLNREGKNIDTLISRGSSGCSIASAILALSRKRMYHLYIRKPNDDSHGNPHKAGDWGKGNAVIVDDFIRSGRTVTELMDSTPVCWDKERVVGVLIGAKNGYHNELPVFCCWDGNNA